MKTKSYHKSNLGSFAPAISTNDGYIVYHDSPRYGKATEEQLEAWAESRIKAVSNAARTEQAERALNEWRKNNG
jgi:hypothetical protein